jgi:hypothetical protein
MVFGSLVYHLQGQSNARQDVDRGTDLPYRYFLRKWQARYPEAREPGVWHPTLIPPYIRVR